MRVLWIVNTIFPYPAKKIGIKENVFGGWLAGLYKEIQNNNDIELGIATVYNGNKIEKFKDSNTTYYLIPRCSDLKYNKLMLKNWKKINEEFKPDLVEIHGTEFPYGQAFLEACPDVKSIVVIQGMVSSIAKVYYANIEIKDIIKNITLRDLIKRDTIIDSKRKFKKRGENEKKVIKKANAIIGRTMWDYANCKAINSEIKYYKGNEILRNSFYNKQWNIDNIEKHSIFCSQGTYPIKGVHYVLEALNILKNKYPDIKLYIGGTDIINKNWLKIDGYAKYIKGLIKKYNLEKNVFFTGILNEKEILDRLLKTHVFVLPSAIENSSNSLGEAMLLGIPCIATNTGGTMDLLENEKEGLLYPYTEPAVLAEYISLYLENNEVCTKYGENARKRAENTYNQNMNVNNILKIYKDVLGGNNE